MTFSIYVSKELNGLLFFKSKLSFSFEHFLKYLYNMFAFMDVCMRSYAYMHDASVYFHIFALSSLCKAFVRDSAVQINLNLLCT